METMTELELKKAKLAQQTVIVLYAENGEIADYGGVITELKDHAVKINGMFYTKSMHYFKVR